MNAAQIYIRITSGRNCICVCVNLSRLHRLYFVYFTKNVCYIVFCLQLNIFGEWVSIASIHHRFTREKKKLKRWNTLGRILCLDQRKSYFGIDTHCLCVYVWRTRLGFCFYLVKKGLFRNTTGLFYVMLVVLRNIQNPI